MDWHFLSFFSLAILFITDYNNVATLLTDFIVYLPKEIRFSAWGTAWNKILENSLIDWIFGNGIGYFLANYVQNEAANALWVSPHNILLDLLYCSGIFGFLLVSVALAI